MAKYMTVTRLIGSDGYVTGCGAQMESDKETQASFDSIPCVDADKSDFCVDLWDEDELLDSAFISSETFKQLTGNDVLSDEEYIKKDQELRHSLEEKLKQEDLLH